MPAVLVHGAPETDHLWDGLIGHLDRSDVVAVSLPGFGYSRPAGFGATKDEYVQWLVRELEAIGGPVDLVGHDWGGGFTDRLVSIRADLVRSWVTDAPGFAHVGFEWHELAKLWQTPEAGEQFWAEQLALSPGERGALFETFGIPAPAAVELASRIDQEMADSILALYRSAVDVGREWGPDFADIPKPGLVVLPSDDPFQSPTTSRAVAARTGAQLQELAGVGHWWALQDPEQAARLLQRFWSSLG